MVNREDLTLSHNKSTVKAINGSNHLMGIPVNTFRFHRKTGTLSLSLCTKNYWPAGDPNGRELKRILDEIHAQ